MSRVINAQSLLNTWQKTLVNNWPKQQAKSLKKFLFPSVSGEWFVLFYERCSSSRSLSLGPTHDTPRASIHSSLFSPPNQLHLLLFIMAKYAFICANRQSIKRIYIHLHEAAIIYAKRPLICEFCIHFGIQLHLCHSIAPLGIQ